MNFLSDVFAVIVGIAFLAVGFAYFTADPDVKGYCANMTANPIDKTGCIIRTTIQSW